MVFARGLVVIVETFHWAEEYRALIFILDLWQAMNSTDEAPCHKQEERIYALCKYKSPDVHKLT